MIDIEKFESTYTKTNTESDDHASIGERLADRGIVQTSFTEADLLAVEKRFIDLMHYRCKDANNCIEWLDENTSELPKITNELSATLEPQWMAIPGMYGGFSYGLFERDGKPLLITDSWVRVVEGSGQTHEITPEGITLVAEGYV